MPAVLSAAQWDPRFEPTNEAFEQWKEALSPRHTLRVSIASLAFCGILALWAWFIPGRYPALLLTIFAVGLIAVFALTTRNLLRRTTAERRLIAEYQAWLNTEA